MITLIILIVTFIITSAFSKIFTNNFQFYFAGRIALSVMLIFTGISHFIFTKGLVMMIPDFIPSKLVIVYFTGVLEVILAIAIHNRILRRATGWILIGFFLIILPANIYATFNYVDFQTGTYNGQGPNYLWFRVPLQILFIIWTYLCSISMNSYKVRL